MTNVDNRPSSSFVLLQVGPRRFALPSNIVAELAPPVRLHTFPHTSPLVVGVIVRRGRIVPVYDVAPSLLGIDSPAHRFYLIAQRRVGKTNEPSAIPVNGECELATGEIHPAAPGQPGYFTGSLEVGEESVEVLDFDALVAQAPSATNDDSNAEAQP